MYLKKAALAIAAPAAAIVFSACAAGAGAPAPTSAPAPNKTASAAPATAQQATDAAQSATDLADIDLVDIDLNNDLMQLYYVMTGFGMDFYNTDFSSLDFSIEDNFHLIQLAEHYIPTEYEGANKRMDAGMVQVFMKEAFGADIPLQSVGMYRYLEDPGVFEFPASDGGYSPYLFKNAGTDAGPDGAVTAHMDQYYIELELAEPEDFSLAESKPPQEWGDSLIYAKMASPAVTFVPNSGFTYFPVRMLNIETQLCDWGEALGIYERKEGGAAMTLDMQILSYAERLTAAVSRDDGSLLNMSGFVTANFSSLLDEDFTSAGFMTIAEDGTITFYETADSAAGLSGEYVKTAEAPAADRFSMEYDVLNVTGNEKADAPDEPNYIGTYQYPYFTGVGSRAYDIEFTRYVQQAVSGPVRGFEDEYNAMLEFANEQTAGEDKELIMGEADSYSYVSALSTLTSAEDIKYFAVANVAYMYAGGAHGYTTVNMFNVNGHEEKILGLPDIFKDGSYKAVLERKLNEMAQSPEYADRVFPDTDITVSEDTGFYLTQGALVIYFHPYDIGPYSSGFILFTLPFDDEMSGILKPEYLTASYVQVTAWDDIFTPITEAFSN